MSNFNPNLGCSIFTSRWDSSLCNLFLSGLIIFILEPSDLSNTDRIVDSDPGFIKRVLQEHGGSGKVIFQMVGGSHAYNLSREDSDVDYIGVYIAPPKDIYALIKPRLGFDNSIVAWVHL